MALGIPSKNHDLSEKILNTRDLALQKHGLRLLHSYKTFDETSGEKNVALCEFPDRRKAILGDGHRPQDLHQGKSSLAPPLYARIGVHAPATSPRQGLFSILTTFKFSNTHPL
jgi:hypothetical protein